MLQLQKKDKKATVLIVSVPTIWFKFAIERSDKTANKFLFFCAFILFF